MNDSARYKQTVWIYKCNDIGNGDRDAIDNFSYKLRNLGSPVLMPSANSSSVHLMETLSPLLEANVVKHPDLPQWHG